MTATYGNQRKVIAITRNRLSACHTTLSEQAPPDISNIYYSLFNIRKFVNANIGKVTREKKIGLHINARTEPKHVNTWILFTAGLLLYSTLSFVSNMKVKQFL